MTLFSAYYRRLKPGFFVPQVPVSTHDTVSLKTITQRTFQLEGW